MPILSYHFVLLGREQNETAWGNKMRLGCRPSQEGRNPAGDFSAQWSLAKHQLAHRLTSQFLHQTLDAFNRGELDPDTAAQLLSVSRAHLFRLRAAWLQQSAAFTLHLSGGDHSPDWPAEVQQFLQAFLPLQRPLNYQLVADEQVARFAFQRDRKSVAAYAPAQELLACELARQNRTVCRITGLSPDDARPKAQAEQRTVLRPCPDLSLLDLHLALHLGRRVNADHQIDFLGRNWPISATARHTVTLIHHPHSQFWVVSQPSRPPLNRWPDILGKFSL